MAFRKVAPNCDVWAYEFARGTATRLTLEGDSHGVVWSPDGERVMSLRMGDSSELITVSQDGSGQVEGVPAAPSSTLAWPSSWSASHAVVLVAGVPMWPRCRSDPAK